MYNIRGLGSVATTSLHIFPPGPIGGTLSGPGGYRCASNHICISLGLSITHMASYYLMDLGVVTLGTQSRCLQKWGIVHVLLNAQGPEELPLHQIYNIQLNYIGCRLIFWIN